MLLARPTKDEPARIAELGALRILHNGPDPTLDLITDAARRLLNVPMAAIAFADENHQRFKSSSGGDPAPVPRDMSLCGHAIHNPDQQMVVEDATQDFRFADNPAVVADGGLRFYAAQPLRGPGGSVLGTLFVVDAQPRRWTPAEAATLTGLARWAESEIALPALGLSDVRGLGATTPGGIEPIHRSRFWTLSPDICCVADADGRLLDHNAHMARLLGYPEGSMLGRRLQRIVHPADWPLTKRFMAGQRAGEDARPFINRIRCAGGAYLFMEWNVSVEDNITYAIARDVSERETMTLALETMNAALTESNHDQRPFESDTPQEIRSPVRAMANSAALLRQHLAGSDEGGIDQAAMLDGTARRMDGLIQAMLGLANVGTDETPHEAVTRSDIIAATMADVVASAPGADIEWPEFDSLHGNATQLVQLFTQLLRNATQYQPPGQPASVTIRATASTGRVTFAIEDNGIGIPANKREAIFAPLKRLHSRDDYGGTGIGLAICRKIIERHGGAIAVDSTGGHGSTFIFDLPLAAAQATGEGLDKARA